MRKSTVLWIATIGFVVAFAASNAALGTLPESTDDGRTVVAWFAEHDSNVRWAVWFLAVSVVLFTIFAALVRAHLPDVHRDLFLAGAVLLAAETSVNAWMIAGLARHAGQLDPSTARTLLDISSYWGPVLTTATVLMMGPVALVALTGRGLPRWVGYLAGIAVVEQVVETVTIFGKSGFIAPGGPMNLVLGALLTTLALLCTGIATARSIS